MLGMGFTKDWQTLAGLRALLGAFEATLFPGSAYLIACWYREFYIDNYNSGDNRQLT
jgi:MFS family permease